jgi:hypothetical protein
LVDTLYIAENTGHHRQIIFFKAVSLVNAKYPINYYYKKWSVSFLHERLDIRHQIVDLHANVLLRRFFGDPVVGRIPIHISVCF